MKSSIAKANSIRHSLLIPSFFKIYYRSENDSLALNITNFYACSIRAYMGFSFHEKAVYLVIGYKSGI